jgi:hypothetical protein
MTAPAPPAASAWWRWWHLRPGSSLLGDCIVGWHVALIPSILIVIAVQAMFSQAGVDVSPLQKPAIDMKTRNLWIATVVSPVIETAVLGLLLRLLEFATKNRQWLALLSALAWGGAHAWFHPMWFFGTVWSFYVFSRGWLAWQPVSYKHAFVAAAVPHALVNSSALLVQFFARS